MNYSVVNTGCVCVGTCVCVCVCERVCVCVCESVCVCVCEEPWPRTGGKGEWKGRDVVWPHFSWRVVIGALYERKKEWKKERERETKRQRDRETDRKREGGGRKQWRVNYGWSRRFVIEINVAPFTIEGEREREGGRGILKWLVNKGVGEQRILFRTGLGSKGNAAADFLLLHLFYLTVNGIKKKNELH